MAEMSLLSLSSANELPIETKSADAGLGAVAGLLLLGAMAIGAPVVLLARPRGDGSWSVESGGEDRVPVEPRLFDWFCEVDGPLEIADLVGAPPGRPLVGFPSLMRWAYGVAVRDHSGQVSAVLVVLDRGLRSLKHQDVHVMRLLARQVSAIVLRPVFSEPAVVPVPKLAPPVDTQVVTPVRRQVRPSEPPQRLLKSREVAALFDVTERTVISWVSTGKLPSIKTIGGHLRFRPEEVQALLAV